MNDLDCRKNPVFIYRDAGYSKIESISPQNCKKENEMLNNTHTVTRIDILNKLYSKMGIVVHPERMSNWYAFTE